MPFRPESRSAPLKPSLAKTGAPASLPRSKSSKPPLMHKPSSSNPTTAKLAATRSNASSAFAYAQTFPYRTPNNSSATATERMTRATTGAMRTDSQELIVVKLVDFAEELATRTWELMANGELSEGMALRAHIDGGPDFPEFVIREKELKKQQYEDDKDLEKDELDDEVLFSNNSILDDDYPPLPPPPPPQEQHEQQSPLSNPSSASSSQKRQLLQQQRPMTPTSLHHLSSSENNNTTQSRQQSLLLQQKPTQLQRRSSFRSSNNPLNSLSSRHRESLAAMAIVDGSGRVPSILQQKGSRTVSIQEGPNGGGGGGRSRRPSNIHAISGGASGFFGSSASGSRDALRENGGGV
ncbi:UNVERIFIED_CONTAM: hypothetical protein HDU68_011818 [Siphonaria sp. JEL0065]|nr:hypothetical protein HDU68_011818 [Siphonaria sp. JEL0065]